MLSGDFEHFKPRGLKEALELAGAWHGEAVFLAGGTDLVLEMKRAEKMPKAVIDIGALPELQVLEKTGDVLRLGAALSFATLEASPEVRVSLPALGEAAAAVGSPQIRSVGTLGGNIATASSAGDLLPALVAYEAQLVIAGPGGARTTEIASFLQNRPASLGADEVIREVRIPFIRAPHQGVFVKLGRRNALAIARMSTALVVERDRSGRVGRARLVLGAVAPVPLRLGEAEQLMSKTVLNEAVAARVAEVASEAVARSIPDRPSAPYKIRAVKGVVLEAIERVRDGRSD